MALMEQPDGQSCTAVGLVRVVQPDFPNQLAVFFDDPGVRVVHGPLKPAFRVVAGHDIWGVRDKPVHAIDRGGNPKRRARTGISGNRGSEGKLACFGTRSGFPFGLKCSAGQHDVLRQGPAEPRCPASARSNAINSVSALT